MASICAHCGSADTTQLADTFGCLTCGMQTAVAGGAVPAGEAPVAGADEILVTSGDEVLADSAASA